MHTALAHKRTYTLMYMHAYVSWSPTTLDVSHIGIRILKEQRAEAKPLASLWREREREHNVETATSFPVAGA